jgi:signal transduction histidine kinase/CheY-like chemotaxis protein
MDIHLFDRNYRYLFTAGKEKEKHNLTSFDFIGKTMFEVMDKKTVRSVYPFYNKALNGEMNEGEVRYKDNIYSIIAIPVKDQQNNTIAGILIFQNITSDKLLEEELKKEKEDAQKADKYKSIFIANMSHEIRTPLNTIIGFSDQIEKTGLTPEQSKYFSFIKKASEHLLHLVNEVVFLFKIGMGKVLIENIPFSLNELFEELENIFSIQAREKNIDFEVQKEVTVPDLLVGDPYRLRQVLTNLLVNAIKYTDRGKILLKYTLQKDSISEIQLIFEVNDTGTGISKKDLSKIFKVFEQGAGHFKNSKTGAGLGLSICKELISLLNGKIEVESKLNAGSSFKVTLPFRKVSTEVVLSKNKKFNMEDEFLSGKKILLADDDEHNRILMNKIMNDWKADFHQAENGQLALKELNKTKFDLVLLDIQMPEMNGVEIIRHIRSDENGINRNTPFLCITANAIKSDINKYLKSGFDDYVIKPCREIELYNKLCNILGFDPDHKKDKIEIIEELPDDTMDQFNTGTLRDTAGSDREFFENMIQNFISNIETLYEVLMSKVSPENRKDIGQKAHKIIPSVKYFGLNKLAESLEKIEYLTLSKQDSQEANKEIDKILIRIKDLIKQAKSEIDQ